MTEKDLVLSLLVNEQDYDLVLSALGENYRQGNLAFKKMKMRQVLSKTKNSKQKDNTLEFLSKKMKLEKYKDDTLENILNLFTKEEKEVPDVVKYYVIKGYYPNFLKEKYTQIVENINQGKYFLSGIDSFQNLQSLEEYYLSGFSDKELSYSDYCVEEIEQWYLSNIKDLNDLNEKLSDRSLMNFHRLYSSYKVNTDDITILKNESTLLLSETDLQEFSQVCGELAVLLAFYSKDSMNDEIGQRLFIDLLNKYNEVKLLINSYRYRFSEKLVIDKEIEIRKQIELLKPEIKQLKKENSKLNDDIKVQTLKRNEIQEQLNHLQLESQTFNKLKKGYEWGLSQDYSNLEVKVVCSSNMLYAKYIFPDIEFVNIENALVEEFNCKYLLIQYYGISYRNRSLIENRNKSSECSIIPIMSRDERELIMDLSIFLKKIVGVE